MRQTQSGASKSTTSPFLPSYKEPTLLETPKAQAELIVAANSAYFGVSRQLVQARWHTKLMLQQWALGQKSEPNAKIMLCSLISLMGGIGSFSIFWVVGSSTPAILFQDISLTLFSDRYQRCDTARAPTSAAISPDYKLLSQSPWKLGIRPIYFPAFMIQTLLFLSKNLRQQKTSINLGLMSPFRIAVLTAGIWLFSTSKVCSSSVLPLGIAWAPQKVDTISIFPQNFLFTISIAISIFTSASAFRPQPDLTSAVVVPSLFIRFTYFSK